MENKIKNTIQNKAGIEELNLMEIVFDLKDNENANDKYNEILKTINEKGFENAANIFSVSSTAKFGGEVGWIKTTQLSDNVIEKLSGLEINKVSKPIQIGNNYIVLKIKEKKIVKENINLEAELNKLKQQETDRQLNQYFLFIF